MNTTLEVGRCFTAVKTVNKEQLASFVGSGTLDVFGTPCMIALMENAAMQVVAPCLEEGMDTVGIEINASHLAPTRLGKTVEATATLSEINKRVLTFDIVAKEGDKVIGKATHKRAIINIEKFMS
ncbi:MAG: thioesterase family protein [Cellulosilyticaceae bacterium]